jgi:hypothetical protein
LSCPVFSSLWEIFWRQLCWVSHLDYYKPRNISRAFKWTSMCPLFCVYCYVPFVLMLCWNKLFWNIVNKTFRSSEFKLFALSAWCDWMLKNAASFIPIYIYTSVISVQVMLQRSLYSVTCFHYCSILWKWMETPSRGNLLCFIMLSVVTFTESRLISFSESGITRQHTTPYCALHKHVSALKPLWWNFLHNFWFVHSVCIFLYHMYRQYQ